MKKISIIIPNYNGNNFLKDCLISLKKQTFLDFELILIDNGSQDESIKTSREIFPQIIIFKFKKNQGFSRAINQGLSLAQGKYIFLLNNDTKLDINCLKNLNNFLDNNPQASWVATKMLSLNNQKIINNAGDLLSIYGLAHKRGNGEKDQGQYNQVETIFSACAGGAIYRQELFKEVGNFDESFFAYLEDLDFSFRAQLKAYKCYYLPSAIVYHFDGGSNQQNKNLIHFLTIRNSLYLVYKNFPWPWLIIFSPFLLISQIRNIVSGLKHGYILLVFKAYSDFIKNIPQLHRKRRDIQKNRQVSCQYLLSIISKKYPFPLKKHFYGLLANHR